MGFTLLRYVFPEKCRLCGAPLSPREEALCLSCRANYERGKQARCPRCGKRFFECRCPPEKACPGALYLSLFRYRREAPGGALLLCIKNKKDKPSAKLLARDLVSALKKEELIGGDCVVTYLPRSREAVLKYGTDQARELAKLVASGCGLPLATLLKRRTFRAESQKELSFKERIANARACFLFAARDGAVSGKRVILIDDIRTSGASSAACARLLLENGAEDAVIVTPGRA